MGRGVSKLNRFIVLGLVCVLTVWLALNFGSVRNASDTIVIGLRLPRVIAAGLAGIGLSISGLLLQTVTGNGLCAPNIIGINSGAGLFVMISLCAAPGLWRVLPLAAFCGALLAAILVIAIAKTGAGEISKTTLILAGVAVGAFANAGISYLVLRYPDAAAAYSSFSVGGFRGVKTSELLIPGIIIGICLIASLMLADRIKVLLLGDGIASSLGVNVKLLRMLAVIIASASAAAVISYAGLLGFVGLAVPHISRPIVGQDIRHNIIACAEIGLSLVILADLAGRLLFAPSELPAGIVTAAIGAPFFIYLIIRKRYD